MNNPAKEDKIDILKNLLREMFQLNRGDLDFGLYRIMSLKAAEIGEFLDKQLLPQVLSTLDSRAADKLASLEQELEKALQSASELGVSNPEDADKIKNLRHQIAEARKDNAVEADVYNHLGNFFARYYSEGDFMSLRRYSGGKSNYLVPYDGEDVKLHWANADQYYIKTTENYASYIFTVGEGDDKQRIRLEVTRADNEKDNIKATNGKQRRFVLSSGKGGCKPAVEQDGDDIIIRFEHRPLKASEKKTWPGNGNGNGNGGGQQGKINAASHERIQKKLAEQCPQLFAPAPTEGDPERTVLAKHLTAYTARNSFDYFIHKDLGGFLERELDLYLNTEVLNLDDITLGDEAQLNRTLLRVRATRHVAKKIIAFIAQLENFQKQLWLKKKFVLDTQYCVTLDRIPESLYAEIAKNKAQREEWVRLFAIDEINGDLAGSVAATKPLTVEFLKANPYLVLDTRHFGRGFTDKLLAALSEDAPLDEQMDGLLIHGENFQALNLLQERYAQQVKCVYIDPPYNSPSSEILYKNAFKHSSWLSMMENRISLSEALMRLDSVFVCAIDENEMLHLGLTLNSVFPSPEYEKNCLTVVHNPKGIQGGFVSTNNEYAFVVSRASQVANNMTIPQKEWEWESFRNWGGESERHTAKNCFYPIVVKDGEIVGFGDVCPDDYHPCQNESGENGTILVYPIDKSGVERKWTYALQSVHKIRHLLRAVKKNGGIDIERSHDWRRFKTVWNKNEYIAGDYGSKPLNHILGEKRFDFPKAIPLVMDCIRMAMADRDVVLDYFAGSGTTGHAVINLNREDGGRRKYILVEMGEHFEDVLLPRIKKAVYSKDWKEGKPVSREGVTQFFKYMRLESYEDTLDGLELAPHTEAQQEVLASGSPLAEDYQLRYALGVETADSASLLGKDFLDPWNYTLSVVRDGERESVAADLPETFNYLIGLRVAQRKMISDVLAVVGKDARGNRCLVLWRNMEKTDNAKLDAWFKRNHKAFGELDLVYANGDNTLNAVRPKDKTWTAKPTEPTFRQLMFEGTS